MNIQQNTNKDKIKSKAFTIIILHSKTKAGTVSAI